MFIEDLACVGGHHALCGSVQQLCAEFIFKLLDPLRQRRLRDMQHTRRA